MAAAALIFDLDGTVWDSGPWFASLLADGNHALREETLQELRTGTPAARLLKDGGITSTKLRRLCATGEQVAVYPNVIAALEQLHDRGVALGAVTNLPGWIATPMLAAQQLEPLLGSVVTFGRTSKRKPAPDPLLLCCTELGVAPDQAWYVGDSTGDCQAAHAGGLSFAWANWGYSDASPDGSDRILSAFDEVLDL